MSWDFDNRAALVIHYAPIEVFDEHIVLGLSGRNTEQGRTLITYSRHGRPDCNSDISGCGLR